MEMFNSKETYFIRKLIAFSLNVFPVFTISKGKMESKDWLFVEKILMCNLVKFYIFKEINICLRVGMIEFDIEVKIFSVVLLVTCV